MIELVAFYKENAAILKKTFDDMGRTTYGGTDAPYVWVSFDGRDSVRCSRRFSRSATSPHPGVRARPPGDGFIRASAFGHCENILEAAEAQEGLRTNSAPWRRRRDDAHTPTMRY